MTLSVPCTHRPEIDLSRGEPPRAPSASLQLQVALKDILEARVSGEDSSLARNRATEVVERFTRGYLRRRHPSKSDAEIDDVAQEVLMKVWKGITSYDPTKPAGAWVGAIASRTTVDLWRRAGRGRVVHMVTSTEDDDARDMCHMVDMREVDPVLGAIRQEAHERVRAAVDALSRPLREAITLRLEGLSYPEIAITLKIPEGTLKSRMHASMRELEEKLADH